jgi:Mitochondrial branched-chain alpha-ketoacid dehydrogenase kinase
MTGVLKVKQMYTTSFDELTHFPSPTHYGIDPAFLINTLRYYNPLSIPPSQIERKQLGRIDSYNKDFTRCLQTIKTRHDPVVLTIAQGIIELKNKWASDMLQVDQGSAAHRAGHGLPSDIHEFLDRYGR